MLVLDTSAAIAAIAGRPVDRRLIDRLSNDGDLHAPHLIDVEFLHALRRLVTTKAIRADVAEDVRTTYAQLAITRYPHHPLSDRMWELRNNLSAYDAAFVALAEELDVPLITCDRRLGSSSGHAATVEVFDR